MSFHVLTTTVNDLQSSLFYLQTESAPYEKPNDIPKSSNEKLMTVTLAPNSLKAFLHCRPCFRSTSVKPDTLLIAHSRLHLSIVHFINATTERRDISIGIPQNRFNGTLQYLTPPVLLRVLY